MSTAGAPATGEQGQDAAPGRRGLVLGAVAALALLVVAAVVVRVLPVAGGLGCRTWEDVRPPGDVVDAVDRLRADVPADVASLEVVCRLTVDATSLDPLAADPRDDPASWVVAVDAEAPRLAGVTAAASALLAAAPAAVPFAWELRVRDVDRSVELALPVGGGTRLAAETVAVQGVPGVVATWFGADSGKVTVTGPDDVTAVLRATTGRDLPLVSVETTDPWVEVRQVHPGAWPGGDAVALALDVAAWDGVWRTVLSGGEPATSDLSVQVADDAQRARVVDRLEALVAGPRVAFHVTSPAATVDGLVGGPPAAPDVPAARGVPACTGAELEVRVVGTDAAAGSRYLFLSATHTGDAPCVVQGFPGLAFTRASGTPTPDLTQLPERVTPPVVVLARGSSVQAEVRWGAMSTTQDPDVAVGVTVQPVAGGPAVDLTLPHELDVLAGATVDVRPWGVGGETAGTGS